MARYHGYQPMWECEPLTEANAIHVPDADVTVPLRRNFFTWTPAPAGDKDEVEVFLRRHVPHVVMNAHKAQKLPMDVLYVDLGPELGGSRNRVSLVRRPGPNRITPLAR